MHAKSISRLVLGLFGPGSACVSQAVSGVPPETQIAGRDALQRTRHGCAPRTVSHLTITLDFHVSGKRPFQLLCLAISLLALAGGTAASARPVEVKVDGFGFLRDRELKQSLTLLLDDGTEPESLDAGYIEDASLVLNAELIDEGFFRGAVRATWIDTEGRRGRALLDAELSQALPRPLAVRRLKLKAVPGVRAVVAQVEIEGLTVIGIEDAKQFFRPRAGWFTPDAARAWSRDRTRRAAGRLREALRVQGFAEAKVEVEETAPDERSGEVRLVVRVTEGPRWVVRGWRAEIEGGGELPGGAPAGLVGARWSQPKAADLARAVRTKYNELGYADARISWVAEPAARREGEGGAPVAERAVVAVAKVRPGAPVRFGAVHFLGALKTRPELLAGRVPLARGAPYDPAKIDEARLRLSRLGVFRRLEASGEETAEPGVRDVLFRLTEEAGWAASWLIGYGSYEQLRAKAELSRGNLWGLAHRDRVEVAQSFKASQGEYRYTVPTLFNDTVEGTTKVYGLRREEPAFLRIEYGAGLEFSRALPWIDARGLAGVSYELLRADDIGTGLTTAETGVTALQFALSRDRRDNPIRPQSGYRWSMRTELAMPELGGDVRYEQFEFGFSWHRPLGADRWLHCGLTQGLVSGAGNRLPLNKLFFPGGESSIRGYPEGEASRYDAAGRLLGVRGALLLNIELEQQITGKWTLVVFSDTLDTTLKPSDWPGDEVLGSVGFGVRYQSLIGPVRLEYGHNLNPRPQDPAGTVHFSIGFPF